MGSGKSRNGHGANTHKVRVQDRHTLVRLIREGVGDRSSNQSSAAKRLGVSQAYYSRLLRSGHRSGGLIGLELLRALRRYLTPEQEQDLDGAVLTPEAAAVRHRYCDWLGDHLELVDLAHIGYATYAAPGDINQWVESGMLAREVRRGERQRRYWVVLAELLRHRVYGPRLKAFIERQERLGYRPDEHGDRHPRVELALVRIITPLLGGIETDRVERPLDDLFRKGELARYLDAAIRCEAILLRRPHDLARIQAVAGG